jgi:hypothetical protein
MKYAYPMAAALIAAGMLWAAATVPSINVRYALPGDTVLRTAAPMVIDPPLKLTVDAKGVPHLGISGIASDWPLDIRILPDWPLSMSTDSLGVRHLGIAATRYGEGFVTASGTDIPTQVALNTAYVRYLVFEQPKAGPCLVGTGAEYSDDRYTYQCRPNAAQDGFVWKRWQHGPVETEWQ